MSLVEDITVRAAVPGDAEAIASLLAACGLSPAGVLAAGSGYWIAEDAGRAVGVVGLEYGSAAALLRSAAVAPGHRGRGIGTMLLERAESEAAARHVAELYLFSTGAGAYWQSRGFVEVPVDDVVSALPDAFQVRHYAELGWLPTEIAWRKSLRPGWHR